jgi:hypothetical protein
LKDLPELSTRKNFRREKNSDRKIINHRGEFRAVLAKLIQLIGEAWNRDKALLRKYFHMHEKSPNMDFGARFMHEFQLLGAFLSHLFLSPAFCGVSDSIIFFTDGMSSPAIVIHLYDYSSSLPACAQRHKYASRATIRKSINIKRRKRLAKAATTL